MERLEDVFQDTLELELERIRLAKEDINRPKGFPVLSDDKEIAFNTVLEIEQEYIDKAKKVIGEQ